MSKRIWTVWTILGTLACLAATAASAHSRDVSVEIVNANGSRFEQFPVSDGSTIHRAYLQAERNARYLIRVRNCTGDRVGVVVAVDGRNIISGSKSDLERGEPMYILGPYESQDYSGWRTSMSDVHEFFFTEWKDSYAEAFGDRSARGVIAVAVYHEKPRPLPKLSQAPRDRAESAPAPPAESRGNASDELAKAERRKDAEPGTGFGDQRYEPVTWVEFEAEQRVSARIFLKYEWQESLCRKGVIDCGEKNRLWNDDFAFAPFPPGR
ncbi:MAG: hypothetical protein ACRETU_09295 [Steroidobacterales bacterium]